MIDSERPRVAVVGDVVIIHGSACLPLWRLLRVDVERRVREGAEVGKVLQEVLDALRAAGFGHANAQLNGVSGHADTSVSDIGASCDHALISTGDLAARLGVSERHARRVAEAEGVTPVRRGWWRTEDAAVLQAARR